MDSSEKLRHRVKELNEIGVALSGQRDINSLLDMILDAAKRITHADAGTLYLPESVVLLAMCAKRKGVRGLWVGMI